MFTIHLLVTINSIIVSMKEGRVYLMTHGTHFYLRLYGVRHMVKDHLDIEWGNPLLPHGLHFPISSKGSFIWHNGMSDRCFMVDPLSYSLFQSVIHDLCNNTFYLRLYGIKHMVKDHSDSERGNQLPPHELHFPISSKSSFICTIPQTG